MSKFKLAMLRIEALPPATEIHADCCEHCPSNWNKKLGTVDPETADIMACSREYQRESLFRCAWRTDKLCKGYCDQLGFTQNDL